jgi:signal transduction histidine kinase
MSPFKSLRSGPFRLALAFAAIFAVGSIVLVIVIETAVTRYAQQVTTDTLTTESARLVAVDHRHGRKAVIEAIRDQAQLRQRPFLYLLTDRSGQSLAGVLPQSADKVGWATLKVVEAITAGDPPDEPAPMKSYGVILADGARLVVGSNVYDVQELRDWLDAVALWSGIGITLLALGAGYLIASLYTQRLERLNSSINTIMGGDQGARVPMIGMGDEFNQLSANLNRMLDRIEALMKGVRQVSTDIAHDLRTPITRLRQHLEANVSDTGEPVPQHVIHSALTQIDAITAIFGALLRIGTLEAGAGRARFRQVDLSEIMERVLLAYQPVTEDEGKTITGAIKQGVIINGDADLLAQMFTNLVDNAIIHTAQGAAIKLELGSAQGLITATVSDNGPGIPMHERENVLKRFYRLNTSRTESGAGLGLALATAIAELHGAAIGLHDNNPGLRVTLEWSTAL